MRWQAVVRAQPGTLLRGGVKVHASTPFATKQEAEDWLYAVGGPNIGTTEIRLIRSKPRRRR